jgi:hypothetical protein
MWVNRPGCEIDHSPLAKDDVENTWIYKSTSSYAIRTECAIKARWQKEYRDDKWDNKQIERPWKLEYGVNEVVK